MPSRDRRSYASLAVLILFSAALALALVGGGCRSLSAPTPRQGWDEDRFGPLVPHKSFPGDCGLCHEPERWDRLKKDFQFDHAKETGFVLVGAHAEAACLRCHNDRGPVGMFVERGCAGCHVDPHESTLGPDCTHCHRQDGWRPIGMVAKHAATRLPLIGAHLGTACDACHPRARFGDFVGAPIACHVCHRADAARATNPDHAANGWTRDCQRCHSPSSWGGGNFNHGFFPLTGAHASADCTACHAGGRFRGTPRDCYSCHQDDYQRALDPNHVQNGFSTQCQICHTTFGWIPSTFNHTAFFPVAGAHAGLSCRDCHPGGNTRTFTCTDCHAHTQSEMDRKHREVSGYTYSSPACLRCHRQGRE